MLPDATPIGIIQEKWAPFVYDCLMLLDSDGCFNKWKYQGAYADQPWIDIQIYQVIRSKWVQLRNEDMENKTKSNSSHNPTKSKYQRRRY